MGLMGGASGLQQSLNATTPAQSALNSSNATPGGQLGANQFLQLLMTEMQNQDPLQPMDDTQSIAQLAQFSSLQATEEMNQNFQSFQSNFAVMQSSALIGKQVTAQVSDSSGNTTDYSGAVSQIVVVNGQPNVELTDSSGNPLTLNNQPVLIPVSDVTTVGS